MVVQAHVGLVNRVQQLLHRVAIVIGQGEEKQRYACGEQARVNGLFWWSARIRARTETVNEQHERCVNDPSSANRGTIAGESKLDPQVELFSIEFVTRERFKYRR